MTVTSVMKELKSEKVQGCENLAMKIRSLESLHSVSKNVPPIFVLPRYVYFIAKKVITSYNSKMHPLRFKSPIFSEILISKKHGDTFLWRRVRIAKNRLNPIFCPYLFILQSWYILLKTACLVLRNGKINWKHGPIVDRLNLKYLGWPYRENIKTAKNGGFCEELLSENDFEAVLATFCCYHYGANTSEAVQKITTDQKDYHQMLLVCYSLLNSQNISAKNSEKRLVTYLLGHLRR